MFDEQLGKKSKSKLGKTILNMITLQQFTDVDFSPLFTALDDIFASTQQVKQDEAEQLEAYFYQFLSDYEFYSTQVTEYTIKINNQTMLKELKLNYNELHRIMIKPQPKISRI
ncbi:unnamed protein product [Paramecium octaurelia]|uniref:Uncharacterized protein n=1 Tax=Paramecium octaurelia TaxID=43137 RepID=A0A8S1XGT9_PAROT|nr:unnamed protein product [Paramecium octaurelia]